MMDSAYSLIVVGLLSLFGVIYSANKSAAVKKELQQEVLKREHAEKELKLQNRVLDFTHWLNGWDDVAHEIEKLFDETCIDRFMVLHAWNGRLEPRWATAVAQMRKGMQKPVSYYHTELDQDYISKIREVVARGSICISVSDKDSLIDQIYRTEGIKHSMWFFIDEHEVDGSNSIAYCSFSTHEDMSMRESTMLRLRLLVDRMKGLSVDAVTK